MENSVHQQELMLVAKAGIFKNEFCEKSNTKNSNSNLTAFEKIEQACWSGLLNELLPELFAQDTVFNKLYLWCVSTGNSSVQVKLGEDPALVCPNYSIDPLYFLSSVNFN